MMKRSMKSFQSNVCLVFLIFILCVTPQACLVEQAVCAIVDVAAHDYHAAPSHKHDEQGQENVFCCGSSLNSHVANTFSNVLNLKHLQDCFSILYVFSNLAEGIFYMCPVRGSWQLGTHIIPIRTRDKYVLSSLLQPPPPLV